MTKRKPPPWGRIAGLLMGCFAVLAGIFQAVDPLTILQRAAISALIVGGMTSVLIAIILRMTPARNR